MKPSVSVLLPVYNRQHRLETEVARILDVLAEVTNRFDLVIIDDGSTDDTSDVAQHLAVRYPQVSVVRHAFRLGLAEALQTGLDNSGGDIVLVGDENYGIDPADLRQLWPSASDAALWPADQDAPQPTTPWIERLLAWKPRHRRAAAGLKIIRRRTPDESRLPAEQNLRSDAPAPAHHGLSLGPAYLAKNFRRSANPRPY